jgi:hypothetical protein
MTRASRKRCWSTDTFGRRAGDGIQHHRDFWRAFEDAPDAFVYASGPASEDANRELMRSL